VRRGGTTIKKSDEGSHRRSNWDCGLGLLQAREERYTSQKEKELKKGQEVHQNRKSRTKKGKHYECKRQASLYEYLRKEKRGRTGHGGVENAKEGPFTESYLKSCRKKEGE